MDGWSLGVHGMSQKNNSMTPKSKWNILNWHPERAKDPRFFYDINKPITT